MKINDKHLLAYGNSPEFIDKEGYLKKRGELNKGFQRRWFVLKGNLLFYSEKRGEKPVGVIILEDCSVEVSDEDDYSFTISFFGDGTRVYTLSADSEDEMISWVKRIKVAPYGYAAMVVKELEKQLAKLKKHEEELLEKQAIESAKNCEKGPDSDFIEFEAEDYAQIEMAESLIDKTDHAVYSNVEGRRISKGSSNRNTIAIGSNPKSFNNLLTVAGAAAKLKNNIIPSVVRSKSSENINKLVSKSPTTSPVPPRRKFHQSIMRKKAHHVKVEHNVEPNLVTAPSAKTTQTLPTAPKPPLKSTFYMLHNRYAAIVWTAIKEFESGTVEDLLKFD